jgi:hypothetical protein
MNLLRRVLAITLLVGLGHASLDAQTATRVSKFAVEEATIAGIHRAFRGGELTALQLLELYLQRIAKYDAPKDLKAFVVLNPKARERAAALDAEFAKTGKLRPLHGIPVVVKDNYDTYDLQTTGGSIALAGSLPPDDCFMVKQLRAAGAIVLGKSNMDEWAFSPLKTVSSILGTTRNPYDLDRVPAGSSGGTAAAVAANLGAIGLGTDTGNSVRGPAAHCALVGQYRTDESRRHHPVELDGRRRRSDVPKRRRRGTAAQCGGGLRCRGSGDAQDQGALTGRLYNLPRQRRLERDAHRCVARVLRAGQGRPRGDHADAERAGRPRAARCDAA